MASDTKSASGSEVAVLATKTLFDEVRCNIRSLLLSSKGGQHSDALVRDYETLCCSKLPLQQLGFGTVEDLVLSMPDVCTCRSTGGATGLWLTAVADSSTAHIKKMVDRQRPSQKASRFAHGAKAPVRHIAPARSAVPRGLVPRRAPLLASAPPGFVRPPLWRPLLGTVPRGSAGLAPGALRSRPPPLIPNRHFQLPPGVLHVRHKLRQLLEHFPGGVSPGGLMRSYLRMFGQPLDLLRLGFSSLLPLLLLSPAIASVVTVTNTRFSSTGYLICPLSKQPLKACSSRPRPPSCVPAELEDELASNEQEDCYVDVSDDEQDCTPPDRPDHGQVLPDDEDVEDKDSQSIESSSDCEEGPVNTQLLHEVSRNMRQVLLVFPDGLSLDSAMKHYQIRFGEDLPVREFGCCCVEELVPLLSDDMVYTTTDSEGVMRVFSRLPDLSLNNNNVFYPDNVAGPGFQFSQASMPHLPLNDFNLEIRIAEVFSPFKFFFHLTGPAFAPALDELMNQLEMEFSFGVHAKYRMAPAAVQAGLVCACPYSNHGYHRAYVLHVETNRAKVYFVDYGTIDWVDINLLRFLPTKFCSLPAQAMLGRLYGVQPAQSAGWSIEANTDFLKLLQDSSNEKYLAVIRTREEGLVSFTLWDTSTELDININDEMIELGHAVAWCEDDEAGQNPETARQSAYSDSDSDIIVVQDSLSVSEYSLHRSPPTSPAPPSLPAAPALPLSALSSPEPECAVGATEHVLPAGATVGANSTGSESAGAHSGSNVGAGGSSEPHDRSLTQSPSELIHSILISHSSPEQPSGPGVPSEKSPHLATTGLAGASEKACPETRVALSAEEPCHQLSRDVTLPNISGCGQLRFVKPVSVSGVTVHLLCLAGQGYMTSVDLSSLFWPKDILAVVVRVSNLHVRRAQLSLQLHDTVYAELIDMYVPGVVVGDDEDLIDPLLLYHIGTLQTLLDNFTFSEHVTSSAQSVLQAFSASDPYWQITEPVRPPH